MHLIELLRCRFLILRQPENLCRLLRLGVGVEAAEQARGQGIQVLAARLLGHLLALLVGQLPVETGETGRESGHEVGSRRAGGDQTHDLVQRYARLPVERLGRRLVLLRDADGIDDDEVGLRLGVGRDAPQGVEVDHPHAPSLHLLEVSGALDVPHEQQAFERLHVRAGGDHVHGDGDPGVVAVAELGEQVLRLLPGRAIGDLLGEVVPLAELFPQDAGDVLGVAVVLGEDEGLRNLGATGENLGEEPLLERAHDEPDLVFGDHIPVELVGVRSSGRHRTRRSAWSGCGGHDGG